jgi:hypothetical protein
MNRKQIQRMPKHSTIRPRRRVARRHASLHHECDEPGFESRGSKINQTVRPSGVGKLVGKLVTAAEDYQV